MDRLIEKGPQSLAIEPPDHGHLSKRRDSETSTRRPQTIRWLTPNQVFESVRLGVMTGPEAREYLGLSHNPRPETGARAELKVRATRRAERVPEWFYAVAFQWTKDQRRAYRDHAIYWMGLQLGRSGRLEPCELTAAVATWDSAFEKQAAQLPAPTHEAVMKSVPTFIRWAQAPAPTDTERNMWDWAVDQTTSDPSTATELR
jgi:hypothetical protein